jgi:4a-hydroxytetrahydrobiopterin dehydratase
MSELLTDGQVSASLAELTEWSRDGDTIVRTAKLPSFPAAIAVVDRVAQIAEARDHHPDIDIRWRTLTFRCSTHSAGGLTAKDVALAREIDAVLAGS